MFWAEIKNSDYLKESAFLAEIFVANWVVG